MKKQIVLIVMGLGLTLSIMAQGSTVKGSKGGSASAGNHKVEATGSKGGHAKVDKTGVDIKGSHGGNLELGKKKKK